MTNFDYRWVQRAAEYMHEARPDLWPSVEDAWLEINGWVKHLEDKIDGSYIGTGSFVLSKQVDMEDEDGVEYVSYELKRNVVDWYDSPDVKVDDDEEHFELNGFDWLNPPTHLLDNTDAG